MPDVRIIQVYNLRSIFQSFAESTMNELLGWYGYETSRDEHKPRKKCRNPSECNDSEGEAVKFSGK